MGFSLNGVPIFAHPRFCPLKKPVFCLRSKFLGM